MSYVVSQAGLPETRRNGLDKALQAAQERTQPGNGCLRYDLRLMLRPGK